jgi:hypothetical protein
MTFDTNYIYLYVPKNIFNLEPSYAFCVTLTLMVVSMIALLYVQARYGTRVFIPKFMLPNKF